MLRQIFSTAALTALALSPVTASGEDMVDAVNTSSVSPVKLVAFDGGWEVLKTSKQLRVWRSHLEYAIAVDADGNATDCEVIEKFRRAYVNEKLCSVLMKTHTFEPARDSGNVPVAGRYTNRLSYLDLREKH